MASILVLGATGYIGGKLVPRLLAEGHSVRCLVRNPERVHAAWRDRVTLHKGDALKAESLEGTFDGIDAVYYLIHSMGEGEDFVAMERRTAANVRNAAQSAGVDQIIYLGGLGQKADVRSKHLLSRHAVGEELRNGSVPITEFRAAVIVGAGSASFEMVHHLVNRLPLMICPRWLVVRTQPLALSDVLRYLIAAIGNAGAMNRVIDIGGPDILTYREMMLIVARTLGLKRLLIQVPVLTPRLSSYWVMLVTPIKASLARMLIESVRHETICESNDALQIFDIEPIGYAEAVRRSLSPVLPDGAFIPTYDEAGIDPTHIIINRQSLETSADTETVFRTVSAIGGKNGWYYANWLWKLRGWIDERLGGVGLRRGRRDPDKLEAGDTLDFWQVEAYEPGRMLLRAEMNVWGKAWLEFRTEALANGGTRLQQTAYYYPKGLLGLAYWYGVYPLHHVVFKGMIRAIIRRVERAAAGPPSSQSSA